jgi:hypothetical protein
MSAIETDIRPVEYLREEHLWELSTRSQTAMHAANCPLEGQLDD